MFKGYCFPSLFCVRLRSLGPFGSGQHPTTALVLQAMQDAAMGRLLSHFLKSGPPADHAMSKLLGGLGLGQHPDRVRHASSFGVIDCLPCSMFPVTTQYFSYLLATTQLLAQ